MKIRPPHRYIWSLYKNPPQDVGASYQTGWTHLIAKIIQARMKIEYRRINHVTLAVPADEHEKVRAFYGGVLGLKEVEPPDALNKVYDLIRYEWLDILLHIDFTPPWTKPAENRHVAVEVKHIHTVRAYLEQQGAEILEAVSMPDRERFYLLDPFGNYFEIMEMKNS